MTLKQCNIKFITGTIPFGDNIYINPAYWTLKSWYKRHGQNNDKINWLNCIHYNVGLNENAIAEIVKGEQPNIICFGLYIWNQDLYNRLGQYIKSNWPEIILIGGGPDIYAHKDFDLFWKNYSWLDYAVYGDGEEAFTLLIDSLFDSTIETINVASKTELKPFRRFKNKEFNVVSPFLDNVNDVRYAIESIKNLEIRVNWEFTKGCPYSCSFCDWSSGLHHKVTRKEYDWKMDLDFLSSLNVTVRWADANIGMFKNDIDIIKYAYALEDANPKFQFIFRDYAKVHKKAVFDIIDYIETIRPGKIEHFLTVQDIDPVVLDNIDRPDVPWPIFKNHIKETKEKHKDFVHSVEVMIGLPGQTLELFTKNLIELIELKPKQILGHIWCMLINSPGYDVDYQKKHGLRIVPALNITKIPDHIHTRDEVLLNIDSCEYYSANVVISTNTAKTHDIMAMYFMIMLYNQLNNTNMLQLKFFTRLLNNIAFWKEFGKSIELNLEKDLQSYNKMLLLLNIENQPVTFGNYFKNKQTLLNFITLAYKNTNSLAH